MKNTHVGYLDLNLAVVKEFLDVQSFALLSFFPTHERAPNIYRERIVLDLEDPIRALSSLFVPSHTHTHTHTYLHRRRIRSGSLPSKAQDLVIQIVEI